MTETGTNTATTTAPVTTLHLSQIRLYNRAPFGDLTLSLRESEVVALTSMNGQGKTTLMSYIVDAFYEMTKHHFSDITDNTTQFYRVASSLDRLDPAKPSLVYLRFKYKENQLDFVDLRGPCSPEQYADVTSGISAPIQFEAVLQPHLARENIAKAVSPNLTKELATELFSANVATYFPAYRNETPGYLNSPFHKLLFRRQSGFTGQLRKPIESTTSLPEIANWIMDVVLDLQLKYEAQANLALFNSLNHIVTQALSGKQSKQLRLGVGQRNSGDSRVQIMTREEPSHQVCPTLFRLSSGEQALITMFAEILRQADIGGPGTGMESITGIVVVDEVDKHLHIKLQKEVLPLLLGAFPKIQFILSSHSPFLGMGLADVMPGRSRIIDIQTGLALTPHTDPQFQEVYEMMVAANLRFREMFDNLQKQVNVGKKLQIVTEGRNTDYISLAFEALAPALLSDINIVVGAEDRSGAQQLKNAFEILCGAHHPGMFLFVWDCDAAKEAEVVETAMFRKFRFNNVPHHTVANKGIENNFPNDLFTVDLYDNKVKPGDYGGTSTVTTLNKARLLAKIKDRGIKADFAQFQSLIDKVQELLNP